MNVKVVVLILVCMVAVAGGSYVLFAQPSVFGTDAAVKVSTSSQTVMNAINGTKPNESAVIAKWFAPLTPFTIGDITMQASIADTDEERAQGLSDTPYIPSGIAKVFVFETSGLWSFWMKDMNYPIDIFWLNETGAVVHVIEYVPPDSYPDTSFAPPVPAKFVIETKAGFAKETGIGVGAIADVAQLLQ